MTWAKTEANFPDALADREVSDALYRTHHEVLCHLYSLEKDSCRFKRTRLKNIAGSPYAADAADEAVRLGLWAFHPDEGEYEVLHHAAVVRQSLTAQRKVREQNAKDQKSKRDREAARKAREEAAASGTPSAPDEGTASGNPHTSIQSNHSSVSEHEYDEVLNGTTWRVSGTPV